MSHTYPSKYEGKTYPTVNPPDRLGTGSKTHSTDMDVTSFEGGKQIKKLPTISYLDKDQGLSGPVGAYDPRQKVEQTHPSEFRDYNPGSYLKHHNELPKSSPKQTTTFLRHEYDPQVIRDATAKGVKHNDNAVGGSRRSRRYKAKSSQKRKSITRKHKSLAKSKRSKRSSRANAGKTRHVTAKGKGKVKSKSKSKK